MVSQMISIHQFEDGCLRVCLEEDGFHACMTCSSYHLVPDKEAQLKRKFAALSSAAFQPS